MNVRVSRLRSISGRVVAQTRRRLKAAVTTNGKVDQICARWDRLDSPGVAVAVVRDGAILYKQGYGCANLEYSVPITPSTVFHVASIAKQFTAFAVALLVDDGVLSLDDDIREHVPEVPDFGKPITIRHLIHHTSGFRDQWGLLAMAGWRSDDVITQEHILTLVGRQKALNFDPGEEFRYCNTGYTLLAEVVARATGQSFCAWTAGHIFEPLGMTSTCFCDSHEQIVPNRSYSYVRRRGGGYQKAVLNYANVGATSLLTTVEDLARWIQHLDLGSMGRTTMVDQLHERGRLNNGDTLNYAFGLAFGEYKGRRTVGHGGVDAGFRSALTRFPDQGLSVVLLSNVGSVKAGYLARRVADIYLTDRRVTTTAAAGEQARSKHATSAACDDYVGAYQLERGPVVAITRRGSRLMKGEAGQPEVELFPASADVFSVDGTETQLAFERDGVGNVCRLTVHRGDQTVLARRLKPFWPSGGQLEEYAGIYRSKELHAMYVLGVHDGKLVAQHSRGEDVVLTPLAMDVFRGERWFFRHVTFTRNQSNVITGMDVSNKGAGHVRFDKQERI